MSPAALQTTPSLKVGLVVGYGTGSELALVFEKVIQYLADRHSIVVDIIRDPRLYHTYFSLDPGNEGPLVVQKRTVEDVEAYQNFCQRLVADGSRIMFKTAINAQSLYLIRQNQEAIKVECFTHASHSLLLVRDQAQGFYSGSNQHDPLSDSVSRSCTFSKDLTGRIVAWSIKKARQMWPVDGIDSVVMVYKFHLFDGIMSAWAAEWSQEYGVPVDFVQPDTANRNLLARKYQGRQVMIAGNEWADVMHVILLDMFGQGAQETRCTENVYLRSDLQGLVEYQTVHGSADDIGGKGVVNPGATIRAAARILSDHGDAPGLQDRVDAILDGLARRAATTKDQGGSLSTDAVVDLVLDELAATNTSKLNGHVANGISIGAPPHLPLTTLSQGKRTVTLVMDFQNDFVTPVGIGAHYRGDMARLSPVAINMARVISHARANNHEIAFVRFLGDRVFQSNSWRTRDDKLGKKPKCLEGSWGAAWPPGFEPLPGERVFDKKAHFDAFLCDGFDEYLVSKKVEHLVFLGVYLDVCVDSTARTAFQKGYHVTIVSDCTTTLHLEFEPYLKYMERLYGARIMSSDALTDSGTSHVNGKD